MITCCAVGGRDLWFKFDISLFVVVVRIEASGGVCSVRVEDGKRQHRFNRSRSIQ
jgi:hypothetical protein